MYVAHQAPLFVEFSRQEYWSGLSFPSPGDCLAPGIEPRYPALQADSLSSEPLGKRQIDSGSASNPGSVQAVQFNPRWPSGPTGFPDTRVTLPECCPVRNQPLSAWSDSSSCPDTRVCLTHCPARLQLGMDAWRSSLTASPPAALPERPLKDSSNQPFQLGRNFLPGQLRRLCVVLF